MKVILADDSALILVRLQEAIINCKGIEIAGSYKNGIDALNALKMLKPDLAIIDMQMPGYSGLRILQEIRKDNKTMKFVILTFNPSDYYKQWAMKEGADYFFSKADDFNKVLLVMEEMSRNEQNDQTSNVY
jgi:DNA-binding NarL/FixJ family response regulator